MVKKGGEGPRPMSALFLVSWNPDLRAEEARGLRARDLRKTPRPDQGAGLNRIPPEREAGLAPLRREGADGGTSPRPFPGGEPKDPGEALGAEAGLGDRPGAVEARRLCCPPAIALRRMRRDALRQMLGGNRNSGVPRGGVNFSVEAGGRRAASLPRRWTWVDPPLWATYLRGRWRRRQTSGRGRCA